MKCWNVLVAAVCLILFVVSPGVLVAQSDPVPNPNCTLIVPNRPLTAKGLATPYELMATDPLNGECHEMNTSQSAFVQAAVFDWATGQISIYNPLVIDRYSVPAIPPVVPVLPSKAIVALWFGYNGDVLTLQAEDGVLAGAACVNGVENSNFGQFAYCNAPAFFRAAHRAIRGGKLHVPALGIASDGQPCPSVRDFAVVDQDQSDNLPTTYLATAIGLAQNNQANRVAFPEATKLGNPSDNRLVDVALDGNLGCTPWRAPDLADPGQMVPALALNELQARAHQKSPVALVPAGDPMVLNNGVIDLEKVNAYRRGVDQPHVRYQWQADTARYCRHIYRRAPARILLDQLLFTPDAGHPTRGLSPDPAVANSLFTFLAQRFAATYSILGCAKLLQRPDPVTVTMDGQGVVTAARVDWMTYRRHKQDLAACERQDDSVDEAGKAAAATE